MDPFKFEDYIAAIYKKLGYSVEQTKKTGDGGKDIIIKKGGKTYSRIAENNGSGRL